MSKYPLIRRLYLYLFSAVGLAVVIAGLINLVNLGLRVFVFKNADYYPYYSQLKSAPADTSTSDAIAFENSIEQLEKTQQLEVKRRHAEKAVDALAMIIVGLPVYLYHWYVVNRDRKEELQASN